jgi:hypothetical protein
VPGRVEGDLDLVAVAAEFLGMPKATPVRRPAMRSISSWVKSGRSGASPSVFWRIITLAELCSMRSMSMRLDVVMSTGVLGWSRIASGRLPMWSRWQCVMMIRSRSCRAAGEKSGVAVTAAELRIHAAVHQNRQFAKRR